MRALYTAACTTSSADLGNALEENSFRTAAGAPCHGGSPGLCGGHAVPVVHAAVCIHLEAIFQQRATSAHAYPCRASVLFAAGKCCHIAACRTGRTGLCCAHVLQEKSCHTATCKTLCITCCNKSCSCSQNWQHTMPCRHVLTSCVAGKQLQSVRHTASCRTGSADMRCRKHACTQLHAGHAMRTCAGVMRCST